AGALQSAHINRRIAEDFARRTAKRTRVQTIRELAALLSDDRHHGREVYVESQHAQRFAGDPPESSSACQITMLSNRPRGRHGRKNQSQPIDKTAFLIDSTEWNHGQHSARTIEQMSNLLR